MKSSHNSRLEHLWRKFEARSDSLSEMLEMQMEGESKPRVAMGSGVTKEEALEAFKEELATHMVQMLKADYASKFEMEVEMKQFADDLVKKKIIPVQVAQFTKKEAPWANLKVSDEIKKAAGKYLKEKMEREKR